MILSNREIVWTPVLGKDSLAIVLERNFANACAAYAPEEAKTFAEGVWKLMGNRSPMEPSNFIDLYAGILPKGFYAGRSGLWLTLDMGTAEGSRRPPTYYGHNEDRSAYDRLWLMSAFGAWARAATTLLEWK